MRMNCIDLFAGVGGMSLGFHDAGANVILANEIDSEIATAYQKNFPDTRVVNDDITQLDLQQTFSSLKGLANVVIGGPPCQGFSQKGQRKTIHDPRNFLFRSFVNVVDTVRPEYFIMENVPNLLSAEGGLFRRELESLFSNLGYSISSGVLNASDFGVPQNRRRAIVLGKLGEKAVPLPHSNTSRVTIWEAISDLAYLNSGEGSETSQYIYTANSAYQCRLRKHSNILYNHSATRHSPTTLERLRLIPPNGGRSNLPNEHLTKSIYSGTWTRMVKEEQSVTITTRFDTPSSGKFTHPVLDRALTVREAARLQSFPDVFRFYGKKSSQMKQVGNAVPPLLAQALANAIATDWKETHA